ncbi:MAG: hypothetical protein ISQ43_00110 [Flavobacteriaceae bacterium]|nr:hypothetical protein [Cryomorphaceae bacterium]MBL6677220.1 hypothetical protein [Flavobacteriaceae bacterium]MDA1225428.1 hypothetical protein [Bacteroidota bacterium]
MNRRLFRIPLLTIGFIFIIMGLRWIFVDEPWMLDKVANEERLNMTFEKLFSNEINDTLPGYLKQIYRFFGLWVSMIGLFIISFLREMFLEDSGIRKSLLICTGLTVYSALIFAYIWIPSSPFIYLGLGSVILHSISIIGNRNI